LNNQLRSLKGVPKTKQIKKKPRIVERVQEDWSCQVI